MHIPRPKITETDINGLIDDLVHLINQPTASELAPCPNCDVKNKSEWINGNCSPKCYNAAAALSEDPERYPIEEHVVPLVFELASMRLVQTCWSCEGHLDIDGTLWKLPQVSFYSTRPIYSQLLCNYLSRLHWKKVLNYPWEIVLTNYGCTWDITYTIRCNMNQANNPNIYLMQKDLLNMADNLANAIKDDARVLIEDLRSNLKHVTHKG